jgi:hypothetical protein
MVVQLGRRRDKHRRRNIPTPSAPSCLNSSIPKRGTLRILSSRERSSWNGASLGKEAVLADSGRAGEVAAMAEWVRSLAFSASD